MVQALYAVAATSGLEHVPAVQDKRAKALIEQSELLDGEVFKEGCLVLLAQAGPKEEQALLGTALCTLCRLQYPTFL